MFNFHFSIRTRILLLIAGALFLSLASYLYIGSRLVIEDKTSYIYDYSFSQVRMVSSAVQTELEKLNNFKKRIQNKDPQAIQTEFLSLQGYMHSNYLVVLSQSNSSSDSQHIAIETHVGIDLTQKPLPWKEDELLKLSPKLSINRIENTLTVGLPISSSKYMITQFQLSRPLFEGTANQFQMLILDPSGKIILSKDTKTIGELLPFPQDILNGLKTGEFDAGVREVEINQSRYLMAYDHVLNNQVFIISLVPSQMAMSAAATLAKKSMGLGLSIFFLAMGSTLLLIRGLLIRVKELVSATERVAQGDFSAKIQLGDSFHDELSALAKSFNRMGEQIQVLLKATATNARMEQELETAHLVQSRFFPPSTLKLPHLQLDGASISASECGGDWWHYAQVQNYLVVIMGDATGHGASAALITASIHSAFSLMIAELQKVKRPLNPQKEILPLLANALNLALIHTAGELSTFPCLLSVIDLSSLKMHLLNAGHPQPILFRAEKKSFESIMMMGSTPLGQKTFVYPTQIAERDLQPGDQVLWYTDGLFDSRVSDGKKIKKKELLTELKGKIDLIAKNINHPGGQSLAQFVLEQAQHFFGPDSTNRPDDITTLSILVKQSGVNTGKINQPAA